MNDLGTTGVANVANITPVSAAVIRLCAVGGRMGGAGVSESGAALNLMFTQGQMDPRITFTRADATSCATYFDSDGLLKVAAANVPRFDYDPATPAGTTGGEQGTVYNGAVTSSWDYVQPTSGSVGVINGVTRVYSADGSIAQFQTNANSFISGAVTVGKTYLVTLNLSVVSGTCLVLVGGVGTIVGTFTTSGPQSFYVTCAVGTVLFVIKRQSGVTDFSMSNISIKEVTFAPRGLLIEESRTNICLQSQALTTSPWNLLAGTPSSALAPDGTNSATTITNAGSTAGYYQSINPTGSTTYTFSRFVKKVSGTNVLIQLGDGTNNWGVVSPAKADFNLDTLLFSNIGAGVTTTGYQNIGGGWYKIWLTATSIAVPVGCAIINYVTTPGAVSTWGCQLELGAFPTSYIPTTTSAVQRFADNANMTGANFSSWFNASAGTFVAEWGDWAIGAAGAAGVVSANDGTAVNKIDLRANGQNYGSGGTGWTINAGTPGQTVNRLAAAYIAGSQSASINGAAVVTASAAVLPSGINNLNIGLLDNANSYRLNGHIRRIMYYNTRLSDLTLQALTT